MKKALIIIDVQNFYFGENGLENNIEATLKAKKLLEVFRETNLMVIHVKHLVQPENAAFEDIHENVKPIEGELVIGKKTPGSFNGTELLSLLLQNEINELVICGMMSHMCVDTTTREAFDLGFKCTVIHDACATRALTFNGRTVSAADVHTTAMAALAFSFAKVISTSEYLQTL